MTDIVIGTDVRTSNITAFADTIYVQFLQIQLGSSQTRYNEHTKTLQLKTFCDKDEFSELGDEPFRIRESIQQKSIRLQSKHLQILLAGE
jgi:hypothetical protein